MLTQEQKEVIKLILHDTSDAKLRSYLTSSPLEDVVGNEPLSFGFVANMNNLPEVLPSGIEMSVAVKRELVQMVKDEMVWRFRFSPEPYGHIASIWLPDADGTVILFNQDKIMPEAEELVAIGAASPYILTVNREQMRCLFKNEPTD